MTNDDFKDWLKDVGVKVEDLTQEAYAKLQAAKAQLDTTTRRKCRLFWAPVCVGFGMICFFAGGWLL